ncbi:MAG: hypothetical protein QE487_18915 [Fluviicola sp.]|nr:hypothetical protein [Fluviicola sp.]
MSFNLLLYTQVIGSGANGSMLEHVNGDIAGAIAAVFLMFVLYITIRVIISFRKEKDEELSRSRRIFELTKRHVKFKKK